MSDLVSNPIIMAGNIPQSAVPLVLLRDLIHERIGTYFDDSRLDLMVEKLEDRSRALNCGTLLDYYYHLKYDDETGLELRNVMDALSVQESYFWREMGQVEALTKTLVPKWFNERSTALRIWSAACASGEEPYSIAMALLEAGLGDHPIQIYGTDASTTAITRARDGIFRERSFRSLPTELRSKYFQAVANGNERLSPEILARVQFRHANLLAPEQYRDLATCPIIFCRNVFIYFSPETIKKTINCFADHMPAGGHLFIGASESLVSLTKRFDLQEVGNAFAYIKRDQSKGKTA